MTSTTIHRAGLVTTFGWFGRRRRLIVATTPAGRRGFKSSRPAGAYRLAA
jgi:hypothetical protein